MTAVTLRAALAIWIAAWLFLTWGGVLDDALIHQRYAERSIAAGFLTFDGVTAGFGPSSLLFVGLLTLGSMLFASPLLPQIVSVVFYAGLLAVIAREAARAASRRVLWIAFGLLCITPMGIRWFTNGMETSLASLLALGLGCVAGRADRHVSLGRVAVAALVALIAVFARIELTLVVVMAAVATVLIGEAARPGARLAIACGLLAGAGVALGVIYAWLGTITPDAAVAKALDVPMMGRGILRFVPTHAAAGIFGLGLPLLATAASVLAWRRSRSHLERFAVVVAVLPIVAAAAGVMVRGQALHGVRYFVPFYVFTTGFALTFLRGKEPVVIPRRAAIGGAVAIAAGALLMAPFAFRAQRSSIQMLDAMRAHNLDRLAVVQGVGFDIGFIAYFTRAPICDLSGLVNGRAHAGASKAQRILRCAAARPGFAFLTPAQAADLGGRIDLTDWTTCHSYPRRNAFREDRYDLLVAPGLAAEICGAAPAASATLR